MSEDATPYVRAWTPDPHRVAEAAIAVLDAGDALLTLLDRVEGLAAASPCPMSGVLVFSFRRAHDTWRTASRNLLDTLNDDEEEVLL
jgi:hypothetical protein